MVVIKRLLRKIPISVYLILLILVVVLVEESRIDRLKTSITIMDVAAVTNIATIDELQRTAALNEEVVKEAERTTNIIINRLKISNKALVGMVRKYADDIKRWQSKVKSNEKLVQILESEAKTFTGCASEFLPDKLQFVRPKA